MPRALAIDIGASSGRHIYAELKDDVLHTREIYRFENNVKKQNGRLVWDIENLKAQVIQGLRSAGEQGCIPDTVAIDTWGVDYVLLDREDKAILPVYAYRDDRTESIIPEVERRITPDELYTRTGIQKQKFNTIYQLFCDKRCGRLQGATRFLMIPEYLAFVLCGKKANEYTNATTTGLINAEGKTWDSEILNTLGLPHHLFSDPLPPATLLGEFTEEIQNKVGYNSKVVLCPTHDTASAVLACPLEKGDAYISSGTWSLMGVELPHPITTTVAQKANITNEGGIEYRYRFLKNIMGLWLIQSIRRELDKKYSFPELSAMAQKSTFTEKIDVSHPAFFAPDSMIGAIRDHLGKPTLPIEDVLSCVYHSLARSYKNTVDELEQITGTPIRRIRIIGGGCQDEYLCRLTAEYSERPVSAGPIEATATGNLISQFMATDPTICLAKAREIVSNTFKTQEI